LNNNLVLDIILIGFIIFASKAGKIKKYYNNCIAATTIAYKNMSGGSNNEDKNKKEDKDKKTTNDNKESTSKT
jgi:hypothetical protein